MNNEPAPQPPVDLGVTPPVQPAAPVMPTAEPATAISPAPKANSKKIIMIIVIVLVALGVGYLAKTLLLSDKVVCTRESDEYGESKEKITGTFKNDKIVKFEGKVEFTLDDEDQAKQVYEMYETVQDEFNDKDGVKINLERNSEKVTLEKIVQYSKLSDDDIDDLDIKDLNTTKKDFIDSYEDQDYSCK